MIKEKKDGSIKATDVGLPDSWGVVIFREQSDGSKTYIINYADNGRNRQRAIGNSRGRGVKSEGIMRWIKTKYPHRSLVKDERVTIKDAFEYKEYLKANPAERPHAVREEMQKAIANRKSRIAINQIFHERLEEKIPELVGFERDFKKRMKFIKENFRFGKPPDFKSASREIQDWLSHGQDKTIGNKTIDELSLDELKAFKNRIFHSIIDDNGKIGGYTMSKRNAEKLIKQILCICQWGVDHKRASGLQLTKQEKKELFPKIVKHERAKVQFLKDDEIRAFIIGLNDKLAPDIQGLEAYERGEEFNDNSTKWRLLIISLLKLMFGCRLEMLMHLEVSQIDFSQNRIYIPDEKMKTKGDFFLFINDEEINRLVHLALRFHNATNPSSPYVFWGKNRDGVLNLRSLERGFELLTQEILGRRFTFTGLRHTFARFKVQSQGVSLPELKELMGHTNITTTIDTYGHLDRGQLAESSKNPDWFKDAKSNLKIVPSKR